MKSVLKNMPLCVWFFVCVQAASQPLPKAPPSNPLMLSLSAEAYVLRSVGTVRANDLEQALLLLPFADALKLLEWVSAWLAQGNQVCGCGLWWAVVLGFALLGGHRRVCIVYGLGPAGCLLLPVSGLRVAQLLKSVDDHVCVVSCPVLSCLCRWS
jgi:hypothetical protein